MLSGIETAGVVLAVFPIAIQGLQVYLEGIGSIKRWWRYTRLVKELIRSMQMEQMKFENSCEELLIEIVDASELERLLKDPGGPLWSEGNLREVIEERLGRSSLAYRTAMVEMNNVLKRFSERLGLGPDLQLPSPDSPATRSQWRRIKITLMDDENKEMLQTMQNLNRDFGVLLGHRWRMHALGVIKTSDRANRYDRVRHNAQSLYESLRKGLTFRCGCFAEHEVALELETRSLVRYVQDATLEKWKGQDDLLFNVVLCFSEDSRIPDVVPWFWREASFEPHHNAKEVDYDTTSVHPPTLRQIPLHISSENSLNKQVDTARQSLTPRSSSKFFSNIKHLVKPQVRFAPSTSLLNSPRSPAGSTSDSRPEIFSELKRIDSLCEAVKTEPEEPSFLGLLEADPGILHRTTLKRSQRSPSHQKFQPLADHFTNSSNIDKKFTLALAIKLASSVLQLHSTHWLPENWGKKDIFLIDGDFCHPYLSQKVRVAEGGPVAQTEQKPSPEIRNSTVFALGVVLIELWFSKSLHDLRNWEEIAGGAGNNSVNVDVVTAVRMVDDVYRQAGDSYGDAVRRCIFCDFDQRSTSLETFAMKEAVHRGVVIPLTNHLKALCGGSTDFASFG